MRPAPEAAPGAGAAIGPGRLPNFFHVGCQKTATSWLHRCFREHPEVYVPERHEVHFFDIHHHKGYDWYREFYRGRADEPVVGDTTTSYVRDDLAAERIAEHNPDARIVMSFRDPVERLFSHYWHEKRAGKIAFELSEVLENYDLFESWVVTGFYDRHLRRYRALFPEERILVLIAEDAAAEPAGVARRTFEFLGVDAGFEPSVLHRRVNPAWVRTPVRVAVGRLLDRLPERVVPWRLGHWTRQRTPVATGGHGRDEYSRGVDPGLRRELEAIFEPHVRGLEAMIGRELTGWGRAAGSPAGAG